MMMIVCSTVVRFVLGLLLYCYLAREHVALVVYMGKITMKILLLSFAFLFSASVLAGDNTGGVEVNFKIISEDIISVSLANKTGRTITMQKGNLPWMQVSLNMRMYGFEDIKSPRPLKRFQPLGHDYRLIEIKPNGTIQGEMDVNHLFLDMKRARNEGDIFVFWFYSPFTLTEDGEGGRLPAVNGMFVIPKSN